MSYIVWIDQDHAKVFNFGASGSEPIANEQVHLVDHPTQASDHLDQARILRKMFDEVAARLAEARRLLIVGPGLAKFHFNTHLCEHFPKLYRKVEACLSLDHPGHPQLKALGRDYFKAEDEKGKR